MWHLINYKLFMRVGVLMITCTGGVCGAELPSLPRIPEETMMELRRLSDACMLDFSMAKYATATKELALALGVEEGVEKEAARFEQELLSMDRVGLGGDPVEGRFIYVGSRATGHREVRFVYLDQRSLGSCAVVIRFIKPGDSWIAKFEIGSAGTRNDLEPFWVVREPEQFAEKIIEFPRLLDSSDKCMRRIASGEGQEALGDLLKGHGSKLPEAFRESLLRSTGAQLGNPPDSFGDSLDYEFFGSCGIGDQELRIAYLWHFQNGDFHRRIPVSFAFSRSGSDWNVKYLAVGEAADPNMYIFTANRAATSTETEQGGAPQPATASESKPEGNQKPQPKSKPAPR